MAKYAEPAVRRYLNDIGRHPLMTADEEIQCGNLVQRAAALKDVDRPLTPAETKLLKRAERAKRRFIEANLRLVVSVAKRYMSGNLNQLDMLDLVQEGSIGLIRAVEMYDPSRGYKFSTYSYWWIRQAMTRTICQKESAVRLPHGFVDKVNKLRKIMREEGQRLGRSPSRAELASKMGISAKEIDEIITRSRPILSLDVKHSDNEDLTLLDSIADPGSNNTHEEDMQLEMLLNAESLEACLSLLCDRDRQVLSMRYGLGNYKEHTLVEIGKQFGVSRERVRQLITTSQNQLRAFMNRRLQGEDRSDTAKVPTATTKAPAAPAKRPPRSAGRLVPEHLTIEEKRAIWSAPIERHSAQPGELPTAA